MIDSLFRGQLRNGRKDGEGITSKENDVFGVSADGWQFSVRDILKRI